jgi:hypothetical protein
MAGKPVSGRAQRSQSLPFNAGCGKEAFEGRSLAEPLLQVAALFQDAAAPNYTQQSPLRVHDGRAVHVELKD